MRNSLSFCFLAALASSPLFAAALPLSQDEYVKRVTAHLILKDPFSANVEAKKGLAVFPKSKEMLIASVQVLSTIGEERNCLATWKNLTELFPEEKDNRILLESLAWSVLKNAENSKQMMVSVNALMGVSFTRDVKALQHITKALQSTNALLRSVGVRLAAQFGDAPLQDEILRLLKEERVWFVKLEAIRAVGALRMHTAAPVLKEIVANPKVSMEERGLGMISLVELFERISKQELELLLSSNRSILRELGCQIVAHVDDKEFAPYLLPLLKDPSAQVRTTALITLGLWQINEIDGVKIDQHVQQCVEDVNPSVAITAGWLLAVNNNQRGVEILRRWMKDENPRWRWMAASAAAKGGDACRDLCVQSIKKNEDPFVKANCAWGLLGQRYRSQDACRALFDILEQDKGSMWMWEEHEHPLFDYLCPSKVDHVEQVPDYPRVVDQMTRLKILSALTVLRFPGTEKMVREYLKNSSWITTSAASAVLLSEGDEESTQCVRKLLQDDDEKIRMQAALMLAYVGGDSSVLPVLEGCYPKVERDMKIRILEAIVQVGDVKSIPFLLNILEEPFQTIRIIAASGIIRCLYN